MQSITPKRTFILSSLSRHSTHKYRRHFLVVILPGQCLYQGTFKSAFTMKYLSLPPIALYLGTSLCLLSAGCTTNTKIDDGSYRAIGQKAPKPSQNYAAKMAEQTSRKKPDIKVGKLLEPEFSSQQSRDLTNTRFGNPRLVDAIVKTAQIHCRPIKHRIDASKPNFWGKGAKLHNQCTYRFPAHCGGHEFSILSHNQKSILVYQPPQRPHYIMDTLSGTPKSKLGLWDRDDHLGSYSTNAGYIFQNDYNQNHTPTFNPSSLGWIISASHQDQKVYGSLYEKALSDSGGCF